MYRYHSLLQIHKRHQLGHLVCQPFAVERLHRQGAAVTAIRSSRKPISLKQNLRELSSFTKLRTEVTLPKVQAASPVSAMASSGKLQLYSMSTPNGQKIGVALEEMGLDYEPHLIHIGKGDQFKPEFVAINPNSKIPALVDPNGPDGKPLAIFESGAILMYLAEKSGKFLPKDERLRWETIEWLFFQMGGIGPMFGQFGVFFKFQKDKVKDPYPLERYTNEAKRLLGVLEKRLEGREYIIDSGFTIADMAIFPWVSTLWGFYAAQDQLELSKFPNVEAYKDRCLARPAVQRGIKVCSPA